MKTENKHQVEKKKFVKLKLQSDDAVARLLAKVNKCQWRVAADGVSNQMTYLFERDVK